MWGISKLIVIDGLDGSGKATQAEKLHRWLKEKGHNTHKINFPAYESDSSAAVKMYLNGELGGEASELNPYMCSTFYAVDRVIQYNKKLKEIFKREDSIIVSDRYISANIIHQGGKLKSLKERKEFFKWAYQYETELLGIPKEDITIFLDVPVWKSQELMEKRYHGDKSKRDIHERDIEYLEMCYESSKTALEVLNKLGHNWVRINCVNKNGILRDKEDIFKEIIKILNKTVF